MTSSKGCTPLDSRAPSAGRRSFNDELFSEARSRTVFHGNLSKRPAFIARARSSCYMSHIYGDYFRRNFRGVPTRRSRRENEVADGNYCPAVKRAAGDANIGVAV